jgi:large subunit ribosomal protein L30
MALKLKVTLTRSGTNRPQRHKDTIRGLGLTRLHKSVILNDTPAIRGMIRAVSHMVRVEPAE